MGGITLVSIASGMQIMWLECGWSAEMISHQLRRHEEFFLFILVLMFLFICIILLFSFFILLVGSKTGGLSMTWLDSATALDRTTEHDMARQRDGARQDDRA